MKFKSNALCFLMLGAVTFSSWGAYYNSVEIDNFNVRLNMSKAGFVDVSNKKTDTNYSCKIVNWDDAMLSGAGGISLTSDHAGLLIASGNKYLEVKDVKGCNGSPIDLHSVSYFDEEISSVIDVNFEKKLVLALVVVDAQLRTYQAIVSDFDGARNIFLGKGFWSDAVKKSYDADNTFSPGRSIYLGKISSNGKYVAPNDLDCSVDSFPGVWDIDKKKKIIFESITDNLSIDEKCSLLFSGKKSLTELGGRLVSLK